MARAPDPPAPVERRTAWRQRAALRCCVVGLGVLATAAAARAAPASEVDLRRSFEALGLEPSRVVVAFAVDPAIARFARTAIGAASDSEVDGGSDREVNADDPAWVRRAADRLYDAIVALKHQGAIEGDPDNTPKARPPKTAAALVAAARGEGRLDRRAGCYELSVLYIAAARSVGLDAVGVERLEPVGSGQIGHVMAGVRTHPGGTLALYDLQNERRVTYPVRELDDLELAAHHYNHRSVAAFLQGDLVAARRDIDVAIRLAPTSASFLNNLATVVAAAGEPVLAIAEATYAVSLAPRVPLYRYQLGRLRLAAGDLEGAAVAFRHALQLRPQYGIARRDLGWALLLLGDAAAADRELARARRDDPDTPEIDLYTGLFYLALGRQAEARALARSALDRSPDDLDLQALARLAGESPAPGDAAADAAVERLRAVLANVEAVRETP